MRRGVLFLGCLWWLFLVAGCGDGRPLRVPAGGVVWVDGKPVTGEFNGFVRLYSLEGKRPSSGRIGSDGRFVLGNFDEADGCPPGVYQVEVSATISDGPRKVKYLIPPRYGLRETSGLTVTISKECTDLVIETKWLPEDGKYRGKFVNAAM
ncbi:MAG: hypothetical protein Q4D98_00895 [Planctomycetia bacterium]|nr:hypothetical protein [Planctomycetia bacterium]